MDGMLILEDGAFFRGRFFGADQARGQGEVVFNTSPTGYQEILTDPSYAAQIVVLSTAHVGNYGVNAQDVESTQLRAAGLIVRDYHPTPSSWRAQRSLHSYLQEAGVPALSSVDTRALVLHIRSAGSMRGIIRALPEHSRALPLAGRVEDLPSSLTAALRRQMAQLVDEARAIEPMAGRDLASRVSCAQRYRQGADDAKRHVAVLDFGVKRNILQQLVEQGCRLTVLPAHTPAKEVLALRPDGLLLSNGPGDPEPVQAAVACIRELLGRLPIFGICLGHQLLALACGGRTYKLSFGHRGGNHPVRNLASGRVEITAQNHGFAVEASSLNGREVMVTYTNLNDDTVEGLRHRRLPAFSVQFHPEASPGPHDSHHLFADFVEMMEAQR